MALLNNDAHEAGGCFEMHARRSRGVVGRSWVCGNNPFRIGRTGRTGLRLACYYQVEHESICCGC